MVEVPLIHTSPAAVGRGKGAERRATCDSTDILGMFSQECPPAFEYAWHGGTGTHGRPVFALDAVLTFQEVGCHFLLLSCAGEAFLHGEACERVGCAMAALRHYERAAALDGTALAPRLALTRVHARCGAVARALGHMTDAVVLLERGRPPGAPSGVPATLQAALAALINAAGMSAVQAWLERAEGEVHPAIVKLSEDAFEWGTDGCED
jgi:hypothetical protein